MFAHKLEVNIKCPLSSAIIKNSLIGKNASAYSKNNKFRRSALFYGEQVHFSSHFGGATRKSEGALPPWWVGSFLKLGTNVPRILHMSLTSPTKHLALDGYNSNCGQNT